MLYSRIIFDESEMPRFSQLYKNIKHYYPESRVFKFKKKLEAESFVMLEGIYLLHKYGYLDVNLRPNENHLKHISL